MPDPAPQPRCSFCGKWQNQVRRLVAGPGSARICGECIAGCLKVLDDDEKQPQPRLNQYPPKVIERARRVRLVVLDVDGVMTDGGMYYGEHGEELKKFNTRDGQGIALLHEAGLETAILTREQTEIVVRRGAKLRIGEVRVGVQDKLSALREMLEARGLSFEDVAYIGDDIHDYEVLCRVGLAVVVQDATRKPRSVAHYVTLARGGEGAVRELCELILDSREVGS